MLVVEGFRVLGLFEMEPVQAWAQNGGLCCRQVGFEVARVREGSRVGITVKARSEGRSGMRDGVEEAEIEGVVEW